jgi:hypothetical protein
MFQVDDKFYTWSSTMHGRGFRKELVTTGAFVIDHISTGWVIIGHSRTVSAEVDKQIALLKAGRHPNRRFQSQFSSTNHESSSDIKLMEFPAKTVKDGKLIESKIRSSYTEQGGTFCVTN